MKLFGMTYKGLPSAPQMRPHLLVAFNDKYILTKIWDNNRYEYFIYTRDFNFVEKRLILYHKKAAEIYESKIISN